MLFPSDILALDLTHGVVYCFVCRDNVYDLDLEKVGVEQSLKAWKTLGKLKLRACRFNVKGVFHTCIMKRISVS